MKSWNTDRERKKKNLQEKTGNKHSKFSTGTSPTEKIFKDIQGI